MNWIEARIWQIGTIGCAVVALGLAVSLGVVIFQKTGLERDIAQHETTIERLSGDLRTCRANTETLEDVIDASNAEIQRVAQAGADKLRAAEEAVAAARGETNRLNARINLLMTTPALGQTVCERVEEVDRAVQEAFQ